ncbi:MAG TPA: hypothetical protein PLZ36_14120, partial [Armatimonadota bacterium]|nr:hypothetical protein [Armatimonadota bacterium]
AFADKNVPHVDGSIDPLRDWDTIDIELLVADLEIVERNIERLSGGSASGFGTLRARALKGVHHIPTLRTLHGVPPGRIGSRGHG